MFPTQEVEILHLATRHKIWKLLQCCLPLIHSVANFNSYISKNKFLRVLQAAFNATMYRNVTMFSYHNHDNIYIYNMSKSLPSTQMIEAPMYLPMFRSQDTSSRHLAAMRGFAGTVVDAIGAGGAEGAEGSPPPSGPGGVGHDSWMGSNCLPQDRDPTVDLGNLANLMDHRNWMNDDIISNLKPPGIGSTFHQAESQQQMSLLILSWTPSSEALLAAWYWPCHTPGPEAKKQIWRINGLL